MPDQELITKFRKFIEQYAYEELLRQIKEGKQCLVIDYGKLSSFDYKLAEELLSAPLDIIKAAEMAIEEFDIPEAQHPIRVRLSNLPKSQRVQIRNIRSKHLGKLIWTDGLIRQASDVRPKITIATFDCPACGAQIMIEQDDMKFKEPARCQCGRTGRFRMKDKKLVDLQRLFVEESPESLEGGDQSKRIAVYVSEDLLDPKLENRRQPGNKVTVVGVVKETPVPLPSGGQSTKYDLFIDTNNIETVEEEFVELKVSPEEEEKIKRLAEDPDIYEKLAACIAPSIYGYTNIKEAIVLQLFGGVRKCILGNTLIALSNGELVPVSDLFEEGIKSNSQTESEQISTNLKKTTISINEDLKLGAGKIIKCWKRRAPKLLYKIMTNGTDLTVTPDHEFMCLKDGLITEVEAKQLKKGDCIPRPRIIRVRGKKQKISLYNLDLPDSLYAVYAKEDEQKIFSKINYKRSRFWRYRRSIPFNILKKVLTEKELTRLNLRFKLRNCHKNQAILFPKESSQELARFIGYLISEGYVGGRHVDFANHSSELAEDFMSLTNTLFQSSASKYGKCCFHVSSASTLGCFLKALGLNKLSRYKKIPPFLMKASDIEVSNLLRALFDGDGCIYKGKIEYYTRSRVLVYQIQHILLRLGILSNVKVRNIPRNEHVSPEPFYNIRILGYKNISTYAQKIGFLSKEKIAKLNKYCTLQLKSNPNLDVIPEIGCILIKIRLKHNLSLSRLAKLSKINIAHLHAIEKGSESISRRLLNKLVLFFEQNYEKDSSLTLLKQFANSELMWDKVTSTELVKNNYHQYVYDLTVEGQENFLANGTFIHNCREDGTSSRGDCHLLLIGDPGVSKSEMLRYVSCLAPKSRYVVGMGTTGAGITASVVKDEFMRGWALEAGAIVLTDNGLVCIDELDKMNKDDRSAMHSAMEQQLVSIHKANIQATLKSRTAVLAAANPKFGRFDPYSPIATQIDLPSTLINRFDLIFTMRDLPDAKNDENIATYILELHQRGGSVDVPIDSKLLRKYIAYAKQTCFPVLTASAIDAIKKFYVDLRNAAVSDSAEIKPIPISARQLQALVRLAEASARVRLSDKVLKKDAAKAIELLKSCMQAVGTDPETGKFDIDRISTGITASKRGRISTIKRIIDDLENKVGKAIQIKDVLAECEQEGIDRQKVEEILEDLKKTGDIYEPKPGIIQKVGR